MNTCIKIKVILKQRNNKKNIEKEKEKKKLELNKSDLTRLSKVQKGNLLSVKKKSAKSDQIFAR